MVLSGNTSVSNISTSSSFRNRTSIGCGFSSRSSQVFGSPSSPLPRPPTSLVFVPSPGYSYTHSPLPTSPAGTWLPPIPRSTFRRYIKTPLGYACTPGSRSCRFGTPTRAPSLESPPFTCPSCHRSPLRSPAPLRCAGPHPHLLGQANTRRLSDVIFLCLGFIHFLCFYTLCS